MTENAIRSTLLALTRALHFQKPSGRRSFHDQFLGLEWWRTDHANRAVRSLAVGVMQASTKLRFGDAKSFADVIYEVLRNRLWNSNGTAMPLPPSGTLFEAIQGDKIAFADRVWSDVISESQQRVGTWLTIYPLHKVTLSGSAQRFGDLRLIAASDSAAWQALAVSVPAVSEFIPQFGQLRSGGYGFKTPANTYLVTEHTGTADGAKKRAAREMSELIALIFAFSFPANAGIFNKSGADRQTRTIQLSDPRINRAMFTDIGELLPPLLSHLDLTPPLLSDVATWYQKRAGATDEKQNRAMAAAAFLHHASVNEGLEQFLHLFIVVDALFGERHKVQEKIRGGVTKVFSPDATWSDRVDQLMDLRSQLVHGVISDPDDWSGDFDYFAKYSAAPPRDAMTMATTALRVFFDLP
jgi:hypothetical protein